VSYIASISTAVPEHCHRQTNNALFYQNTTTNATIKRMIGVVAAKSGIDTRYSVLKDYSCTNANDFTFFPNNAQLEPAPTISQRMQLYRQHALQLATNAVCELTNFDTIKHAITHVITVSCTGMYAPGLDIELIQTLQLKPTTQRSSINFMGCNAAILALNSGNALCNSIANATVLIVCVELCTLHFQRNYSDDYLVSNTLFADGAAAVLLTSNAPTIPYIQGLQLKSFNSLLLHKGNKDMAWELSETGFIMNLSSYVSGLINGEMQTLLSNLNISTASIDNWAIHPGGKRIIDDFARTLHLTTEQIQASYDVLRKYGNMSSATILFVLQQVIATGAKHRGATIFTAAFGPGLSIETLQLQYV
jgi:alpha-pyrone synthase